jgi:hypothetical protein
MAADFTASAGGHTTNLLIVVHRQFTAAEPPFLERSQVNRIGMTT